MAPPTAASPIRVAIIDDDSGLVTVLDRRFARLRWEREVIGYAATPDQLSALRIHAVILNPEITGLDYLERIALALPGLALLVCTGTAPVADRVRGLRGGADDWITKPCHPEELMARVEAVLRRRRAGELPTVAETIAAGELEIRPEMFDAFVGDRSASLSRKEYELLRQLAAADGRVLEREDIYQRVWGYTMVRGDRSVDVFVRKLRQKLEALSPEWRYVHTHFGVGYRFAAERVGRSARRAGGQLPKRRRSLRSGPRATRRTLKHTMSLSTARNILIIVVIAALVVVVPGGGTGATVVIQAVSLLFLACIGWVASIYYRQYRTTLYSLGDARRAVLYGAVGVATLTLTGTSRLWGSSAGSVAWLLLMGASVYAVFAVVWSARKY